jgi:hypothetical protein
MAKKRIQKYLFFPGTSGLSNAYPNAYFLITSNLQFIKKEARAYINSRVEIDTAVNYFPVATQLLTANKTFILKEMSAWIKKQISDNTAPFSGYVYNTIVESKCERDVGYLIDSYIYDLRYGGNERTIETNSFFYINEVLQLDFPVQEAAVHTFLTDLLSNYVLKSIVYPTTQTENIVSQTVGASAEPTAITKTATLSNISVLVITSGLEAAPAVQFNLAFANYIFDADKCERDIGYVLDAYLWDLRYNGNRNTRITASKYWVVDTPQVDGNRQAEVETHAFIRSLINDYIITNQIYPTQQEPVLQTQVLDVTKTLEANAANRITYLSTLLINVINNGLTALPALIPGVGLVYIQGKWTLDQILLMTNVSNNTILYNFADPGAGSPLAYADPTTPDVDTQIDYGFTGIVLNKETLGMSSNDEIQVFVEDYQELRVRPYDFGTDAIERQRVANAQSMLDADFEYGLQPTKWQALALSRSYPGTYEVPGTEIRVLSVITDASAPTGGVGQSLITVVTEGAHGLVPGAVLTMRNLDPSIRGFGRAEGVFICNTTPSSTSFTYFAKARVGTSAGLQLVLASTQFKRSEFFTGAAIGGGTFSVFSQGASGTFTPSLIVPAGTSAIPFTGSIPVVNAPVILQDFIDTGTTITSISGTGSPDVVVYSNISGQNISGLGVGAEFDISRSSGAYSVSVVSAGTGYAANDQIIVFGTVLDGVSPGNDCLITVQTVDTLGEILTVTSSGTGIASGVASTNQLQDTANVGTFVLELSDSTGVVPGLSFDRGDGTPTVVNTVDGNTITISRPITAVKFGSDATFTSISAESIVGIGTSATFDVDRVGETYTATIKTAGTDYLVGDTLVISGSSLGGTSPTNDLYITVTSVGVAGEITGIDETGAGLDFNAFDSVGTTNLSGNGSGATFDVERSANSYINVTSVSGGLDYIIGDVLSISGVALDGTAPTNDITVTVTDVSVLGAITDFTFTGVANNKQREYVNPNFTTSGVGTGAAFTVTSIGSSYVNISIDDSGDDVRESKVLSSTGATSLSSAQIKYGTAALSISNAVSPATATSYFTVDDTADFVFGTAPFTIELDVFALNTGVNQTLIDMRQTESDPAILLGVDSTNLLYLFVNGSIVATASSAISEDTWHHIEISSTDRTTSGTTRIFLDGTQVASWTDGTVYGASYSVVPLVVGADFNGAGDGFNGYVDELRISTVARNTANYTSPSNAFLHDSNTVLLVHFDGPNNTISYEDDVGGYKLDETILILGSDVGGVDSTNDVTITITSVSAGQITGITYQGSASDLDTYSAVATSNLSGQGSGLTFNVVQSGTVYQNISISAAGSAYRPADKIAILGTDLGGATPANDILITVSTVGGDGSVSTFTVVSGTAAESTDSYLDLASSNTQSRGQSAIFAISKSEQTYTINVIETAGTNYKVGNRLLVSGAQLGGAVIVHNATITVNTVDANGGILTASITGTASGGQTISFLSTVTLSEPLAQTIPTSALINFNAVAKIQVTFNTFHGLVPGSGILVQIQSSGLNQNLAAGTFFVEEVPEPNIIRYTARSSGNVTATGFIGEVYSRTDAFFTHRPFDGGVQLGAGGPQHAAQAIRMSKNYIRYQSGKGLMYTTGALFAPSFDLSSATADGVRVGSTITFVTDDVDHGLQVGAEVRIIDIETTGYNNTYIVSNIIDEQTFQVKAIQQLGSIEASIGQGQVSLFRWSGATVRAGCFDEQNGMYWQYDGARIAVGVRSSTLQLVGTASVTPNSNLITGTRTRFRDQLAAGDKIVIRGMTHTVSHVIDQTTMYITPDYRGVSSASKVKLCKVVDRIFYQDEWNRDSADGTGPSGYNIDVTKMQMIGIQYTWYGAGFIDFMLRGKEGNFLFVHRIRNNNVNTEAYMRSANLPVRYEVINDGAYGKLALDVAPNSTIIPMSTTENFPNSGVVYVDNELIGYSSKTTTTLNGLTRSTSLNNFVAGAPRSYTAGTAANHSEGTGVILVSNRTSPIISHWGSAYLTDGGFDEDRGYLFNYQATSFIATTTRNTAFLLRLSPSVSNAVVGDLGERELINRAQLLLQGIEVTAGTGTASGIVIEGILNPSNYPRDAENIDWQTLASPGLGGQPSFAQVALGSTVEWDNQFTVSFNANTVENRNRPSQLRFVATDVANVRVGMTVGSPTAGIQAIIPGGTLVSGISGIFNISGVNYREIFFNRQFTGNVPNGTAISFSSIAAYAAPGEAIFSFVGLPNTQTALDLTKLKEITNTAIGGRGVFPNGPDVLAINCYLTGGNQQEVSIVLRWSEAQA